MIALRWLKHHKDRNQAARARFNRLAKLLESPIERLFWQDGYEYLSQYGRFTPQQEIGPYRVDFTLTYIAGVDPNLLKIAIELYGYEHHNAAPQVIYDAKRTRYLQKKNWKVIIFWGSEIYGDCAGCVRETIDLVRAWSRWLR